VIARLRRLQKQYLIPQFSRTIGVGQGFRQPVPRAVPNQAAGGSKQRGGGNARGAASNSSRGAGYGAFFSRKRGYDGKKDMDPPREPAVLVTVPTMPRTPNWSNQALELKRQGDRVSYSNQFRKFSKLIFLYYLFR
jgi:hypothetical protein